MAERTEFGFAEMERRRKAKNAGYWLTAAFAATGYYFTINDDGRTFWDRPSDLPFAQKFENYYDDTPQAQKGHFVILLMVSLFGYVSMSSLRESGNNVINRALRELKKEIDLTTKDNALVGPVLLESFRELILSPLAPENLERAYNQFEEAAPSLANKLMDIADVIALEFKRWDYRVLFNAEKDKKVLAAEFPEDRGSWAEELVRRGEIIANTDNSLGRWS